MLKLTQQSLGNVGRNVATAGPFADLGGKPPRNSGRQLFGAGRLAHALIIPMVGSQYWASLMTRLDPRARIRHGLLGEPAGRGCVYAGLPAGRDADLAAVGPGGAGGRRPFGLVSVNVEIDLREMGLDDDQGLLPNVPRLLRKLSCQASTTRPSGGQSAGHRRRAAVLRRRERFLPGSGRRAVSPGGAGRGSPRPGRSRAICRYFRGRSAAYLVGVLPEDERAICRKRTYVIPLNTTSGYAQGERGHLEPHPS